MLRQQTPIVNPGKLRKGSLRWCAARLGVSAGHLVRVRDGERPNVNHLLERYRRLLKENG